MCKSLVIGQPIKTGGFRAREASLFVTGEIRRDVAHAKSLLWIDKR